MARKTVAELEKENAALTEQVDALKTEVAGLNDNNRMVEAELKKLKATPSANDGVALADSAKKFQSRYAKEIKAKMQAGLSRDQAIEAQEAQVREDATQAAAKK